jgi:ABC-type uncharacterized transport system permease subunit
MVRSQPVSTLLLLLLLLLIVRLRLFVLFPASLLPCGTCTPLLWQHISTANSCCCTCILAAMMAVLCHPAAIAAGPSNNTLPITHTKLT